MLRRLGLTEVRNARRYPVKHGVRVHGEGSKNSWFIPVSARNENWELKAGTTGQVRRSDFDGMMLATVIKRGATLVRGTVVKALLDEDGGVPGVTMRNARGARTKIPSPSTCSFASRGSIISRTWSTSSGKAFFLSDLCPPSLSRRVDRLLCGPGLRERAAAVDGILIFRKMFRRGRDYDHQDDYSVPIGSRYHPERAALWAPDSPVETTEVWLNSNLQEA